MSSKSLYTANQTRELDRLAIEDGGIPGLTLMTRAGRASLELVRERWPARCPLVIFCGTGNNGGDGFVLAALAIDRHIPVTIVQVGDADKIGGDAASARQAAMDAGVECVPFNAEICLEDCVIVDALLGTGLNSAPRDDFALAITAINDSGQPVLALDVPSGLSSDTGCVQDVAVRADITLTFIAHKQGLLTGDAPAHCGELLLDELSLPQQIFDAVIARVHRLSLEDELAGLPLLTATAHKGHFGHALVVGGDLGFAGAGVMAAEAAARCGAGRVSAATRAIHMPAYVSRRPELMTHGVEARADLTQLINGVTALAVGPGLGQSAWSDQMLQICLESELPTVVDADGLNLLAKQAGDGYTGKQWILTPHPGEAARLLDATTGEVQADRFAAVRALQARYSGVIVLKGSGTLICDGEQVYICPYGNPGMASGGMGDVLTGVLVALLAQGLSLSAASRLGVCLHAAAADIAAEQGMRGLLATDLLPALRMLLDDGLD